MIKKIWHSTLLWRALISCLIFLVTLEILLRIFFPAPVYRRVRKTAPDFFRSTDWLMQPVPYLDTYGDRDGDIIWTRYGIHTNADGLRTADAIRTKDPQVHRILALGDSFTFGTPVGDEETYAARLEGCLAPVEAINAGYNGFSHDAYYVFYHQLGYLYQPDTVTLGLYVANDLQDIAEMAWKTNAEGLPIQVTSRIRLVDERLGQIVWRERPINYRIPVLRELHVFQYAFLVFNNPSQGNYLNLPAEYVINDPFLPTEAWNEAGNDAFNRSTLILGAFQREFAAQGIHFLVILIPETTQLESSQPLAEQNPQARYREFFEQSGIDYLDLLPILANYETYDLYTSPRRHWTAFGHEVAAEAMCAYMQSEGWIP